MPIPKFEKLSPDQAIQYAVQKDADLSKEQIREMLYKDLQGVYLVLADVLRSKECVDALTDVYYKRYTELHMSKVKEESE